MCPYETLGFAAVEAMASGLPVLGLGGGGNGHLLSYAKWDLRFLAGDSKGLSRAVAEKRQRGARGARV